VLVIEAIREAWANVRQVPVLGRIGLGLMVVAVALDLALNLAPAPHAHAGRAMEMPMHHEGHLLALLAMGLVLAGVVVDGVRRHRSRRRSSHAHR
jgi:hypothetical protein